MYFNLIITGFKNPRAKTVVARHLAHTPTISLQKALAMVENPPFEYMKDLSVKDLQEQCSQLVKMGILYKVEEVTIQLNESIPTPVPIPQDDEKITIKDLPQESTQHPAIPPPPPTKTFQTVPHILPAEPPAENTLKVRIATVLIAVTLITLFLSLLIIGNRPLKIKTSENFSLVS
ncbi:MAG: hypothetical protein GX640_17835, partial [Fibrobacter sp.]|nr:hypothetical protein [Fibrobacter sp.]